MPRRILPLLALLPLLLAAGPLGGGAGLGASPLGTSAGAPEAKVTAKLDASALQPGKPATVAIVIDVPPGLHAQSHTPTQKSFIPLTVTPTAAPGITFGPARYPPGVNKTYPSLGELNVYDGQVIVRVPVTIAADAPVGPVKLAGTVRLQMCDDSYCYPPKRVPFTLDTEVAAAGAPVTPANADLFPADAPTAIAASEAPVTSSGVGTILLNYATAFLVGLVLNLMPCVLPVLPLKAIGFYETAQHNRSRSVGLALAFSAGIVLVFAVLAIFILVLKRIAWGEQFSNPYFAWGMVGLLLGMALWLMGAFRPMSLPTWAYAVAPRHDTVGGNVAVGAFTALLSTPCTAPLLPPLLAWAALQPTHVGVPAMLMVGVGMAFPYVLLSAFPQWARRFPRVGPWAELFKQMMGFLLIGSAVYFAAGRVVAGPAFWWAVVAVAGIAAVYLLVRTIQLVGVRPRPIAISAAIGVLLFGATTFVAAAMNGLIGTHVRFEPFTDARLAELRAEGKPVLVKFTANWCANCQVVEGTVFRNEQTVDALRSRDVVALKADLTHEDAPGTDLLKQLNPTGGIPLTVVYPPTGEPLRFEGVYTSGSLIDAVGRLPKAAVALK